MKKLILSMITLATLFVACKDDKDDAIDNPIDTLQGNITVDTSLDASITYELTGALVVQEGATLTIPAGTKIVADDLGTDVYIAILKGAKIDIQGTASNPVVMTSVNEEAGDWGGLTICGDATTTNGVDATAEVGGFIYGGSNDADNSGSIENLIIKGTGAQINTESQYNGISFYAVGSGTTVNNIAVIDGADDGVEFFGGTVSATNVYLENNEDDSVDWTEGWSGKITNLYISHTVEGFSTAFEGDKLNGNPKFENVTAISTVGGTALQFKLQSGATITNLFLSGYTTNIDMKDGGALSNVQIEGVDADLEAQYKATQVDISGWEFLAGAASQFEEGVLVGEVNTNTTLDASIAYELKGTLIVASGATLTIPAGTTITSDALGTDAYIAVLKGGKIDIQGTASNPVVMTSVNEEAGDWGGLTICGDATTTNGVDATAEVGGFIYGGSNDADNSGSIEYLIIKGTGAQINTESQYNGISFYAVGSGTTVNNIAVIDGADDGIEFFGGTVSATNVYLENNEDDSVDWTEGWNGTITDLYISHTIAGFSTAFEGDKINGNPKFVNVTAISTVGGTGLQFKVESGATITNLFLSGYTKNIDMKDGGALSNVQIDGADASTTADYTLGTKVDITSWTWLSL